MTIHGKDHWVSDNGKYAIWFSDAQLWHVGFKTKLGLNMALAYIDKDNDCPHVFDYGWKYWSKSETTEDWDWTPAEKGLNVNCG